jgi:hypothetical protein
VFVIRIYSRVWVRDLVRDGNLLDGVFLRSDLSL